jgi:putative hydrolase of the HAD superfamily
MLKGSMKALLVDLDDTLLDYSGGVEECWTAACKTVAGPAGINTVSLVEAIQKSRRWFWDDPERHRRERVDMMGAWRKIVIHGLDSVGSPDHELAGAVAEDFAARRWVAMTLFPGVREALEGLRAQAVSMALVTNGDKRQQREKIERYGLGAFFDVIVIEGEFGAGKPEEIVYRHALERLGIPAGQAWMVGDHIEWDVAAPQRLGLTGVWVDRAGAGLPADAPVRPHHIVREFRELLDPAPSTS